MIFGPVAAWQPGESSISDYQDAYGPLFHGDSSGKINAAEKEVMAAFAALSQAKIDMRSDDIFWLDPWSAQGQAARRQALAPRPANCASTPSRPSYWSPRPAPPIPTFASTEALTALDLGARRLDLIGMKFEMAQEIAAGYAQARPRPRQAARRRHRRHLLEETAGDNGLCEDLRDAYSAIKAEYSQVWLTENRPWWLNNVTVRYDLAIQQWERRAMQIQSANWDFRANKPLPPAAELGIPAPLSMQ